MIKRLRHGYKNCYLLKGDDGGILVDTGYVKDGKKLFEQLKEDFELLFSTILLLVIKEEVKFNQPAEKWLVWPRPEGNAKKSTQLTVQDNGIKEIQYWDQGNDYLFR